MFKILKEAFGSFEIIKIKNETNGEYISFIPGFGASIHQLTLKKK